MEKLTKEPFDLESVYDEQIAPLMTQIIEIVQKHKMPMFATFVCMNDPDGEGELLCTTNQMPAERPIPAKVEGLIDVVMPRRVPPLHLKVTHADGSVDMTTIVG
jgi:hypothetical protein